MIGLPASRMNGIRIKQSQAQVACQAPLELLHFIETMSGSSEIKKDIDACNLRIVVIAQDIAQLNSEISQRNSEIQALGPSMDAVTKYFQDLWQLYCNRLEAVDKKMKSLASLRTEVNEKLKCNNEELKTLTKSISELEGNVSATTARKTTLKGAFQKKQRDLEGLKRLANKASTDIAALQQRITNKKAELSEKTRGVEDSARKVRALY